MLKLLKLLTHASVRLSLTLIHAEFLITPVKPVESTVMLVRNSPGGVRLAAFERVSDDALDADTTRLLPRPHVRIRSH